jgi:hypothetical protein
MNTKHIFTGAYSFDLRVRCGVLITLNVFNLAVNGAAVYVASERTSFWSATTVQPPRPPLSSCIPMESGASGNSFFCFAAPPAESRASVALPPELLSALLRAVSPCVSSKMDKSKFPNGVEREGRCVA